MRISSETILASLSPQGYKLITLRVTFPRIILPEFLTHRQFSRNFSSNRAITVGRSIGAADFVPMHWGLNRPGMQASEESIADPECAARNWQAARSVAQEQAANLAGLYLHKQTANRLLEPFQWVTGIVSFTSQESGKTPGENFFAQRCSAMAEPHMCELAWCMADSVFSAHYQQTTIHCPLVSSTEMREASFKDAMNASAMRCARVSYNNLLVDGTASQDAQAAREKLMGPGGLHGSPFEHQAVLGKVAITSNFRGDWLQYRTMVEQTMARQNQFSSFGADDYRVGRPRRIQ
jgi:hypothetical protein